MTVDWSHSRVEVVRRSIARWLSLSHWEARRKVLHGFDLPHLPRGLEIWAIAMVKNEADIVESLVGHLLQQQVDAILIVDNGSTDGTKEILEQLAENNPVFVGTDTEVGYFQDHKMSRLATHVRRHGATWVVPVDADEFWFARNATLGDTLRRSKPSRLEAKIFNVFPSNAKPELRGPVSGEARLDLAPHKLPKVAARTHPLLWLSMGNHFALRPGVVEQGLFILHYPWRSYEQFERKLRQGAVAMRKLKNAEKLDTHWQRQDAKDDDELAATWRDLLEGYGDEFLGWRPVGPFRMTDPSSWKAWGEDDVS